MIVADTNLIIYLYLEGEHTELAEKVLGLDSEWVSPSLWLSEFRNVLALYLRKGLISIKLAKEISLQATKQIINISDGITSEEVLELTLESGCSAYDCEYIVLAKQLNIPLITFDTAILKKFPKVAISAKEFVGKMKGVNY